MKQRNTCQLPTAKHFRVMTDVIKYCQDQPVMSDSLLIILMLNVEIEYWNQMKTYAKFEEWK